MIATRPRFGPADHGLAVSWDEFLAADYRPGGYKYELIDGRLWVSYEPDPAENVLENWLYRRLLGYSDARPDVLNFVTTKSWVFVPGRERPTAPEPDLSGYRDFPFGQRLATLDWRTLSPVLVVEVVVNAGPEKDLERNVELYHQVPSIAEYWVLDGRDNPDEPTLVQHRRYGKRWVVRRFPYGTEFAPKLLPGFALLIDPRK
jgi:Uma2 family endonuclease